MRLGQGVARVAAQRCGSPALREMPQGESQDAGEARGEGSEMKDPKVKQARLSVEQVSVFQLQPSPENTKLYRPPSGDDPAIIELANDIKANGVREPLIISADSYIISG